MSSSNIAAVPDKHIVIRPGQSAVVTATSAANPAGCVTTWTLGITLPGVDRPVSVRNPGSFVRCVGGQLALSPFYTEQVLRRDIKALRTSTAPPLFPVAAGREPTACKPTALRAQTASAVAGEGGSVIVLRLRTTGAVCALPGDTPTVRLHEAGGASPMAKIFPEQQAARASRSVVRTYGHGSRQGVALPLRPGIPVAVTLLAARPRAGAACKRVNSVTIYPGAAAIGPGRTLALGSPVRVCGLPRILPFLPGSPAGEPLRTAYGALSVLSSNPTLSGPAAELGGTGDSPDGDSPGGFWYGNDSSIPDSCGSGPYNEPVGDCGNGTDGAFGGYFGMEGAWNIWQGCTSAGTAWNQNDFARANGNFVDYNEGVGSGVYWYAAGPGRDPNYNGTDSEAYEWGTDQAQRTVDDIEANNLSLYSGFIILDIETSGDPDGNGWNAVWNSACGNTVKSTSISSEVDHSTYSGFWDWIWNDSSYFIGVYSAGGGSYGSWSGIMGNAYPITETDEWTFTDENSHSVTSSSDFPSGFSTSYESASWFGGAPDACHMMWQWEGGNGASDGGYGDFDQIDGNNWEQKGGPCD